MTSEKWISFPSFVFSFLLVASFSLCSQNQCCWAQGIFVSLAQDMDSRCCSAWREQSRRTWLEGFRDTLGLRAATGGQALWVCGTCSVTQRDKEKCRRKRDCGANCRRDCPAWGMVQYIMVLITASMGKVPHMQMADDRSTKKLYFHRIGKLADQPLYIQLNERQSCVTGGLAASFRANLGSVGESTSTYWVYVISHCLFSGASLAPPLCHMTVDQISLLSSV